MRKSTEIYILAGEQSHGQCALFVVQVQEHVFMIEEGSKLLKCPIIAEVHADKPPHVRIQLTTRGQNSSSGLSYARHGQS